jgi:hypothetical protein
MGAISYYLGYSELTGSQDKAKEQNLKDIEGKLQVIVEEISRPSASATDANSLDGKQKPLSRRQRRRLKRSLVAQLLIYIIF